MRYSANEVEAALTKAAVAKCYPYGIATDIAAAAVLLSAYGVDGVAAALHSIGNAEAGLEAGAGLGAGAGAASALGYRTMRESADEIHFNDFHVAMLGTVAAELACATTKAIHCHNVDSPLLLAGFVALAASRYGVTYQLNAADVCLKIPECCSFANVTQLATGGSVLLTVSQDDALIEPAKYLPPSAATGIEVLPQDWQTIQLLAAQTYVAATAESHNQGAGAGEIDND